MAIDAGTLEIKMLMGLARLQQDVTQAKDIVGRGMAGIQSAVSSAKTALAGLGVTLGAGAFAALVKGSIDAMDHLNDLSKSTGLAVETLSGLRIAAKQSGTDLDGVAASINKLSVNMGQNSEKFRALGVTAKDPLEAFKQLADVFSSIQDPQLRAALGAEALGKSWATAAPLLAEGGAKIGQMVEKGAQLSGVTKEMAEQADAFNDKLTLLTGTQGTWNRLIGPVLPLLNILADQLLKSREEAAKLGESDFKPLLEAGKAITVFFGNVLFVLKGIGTEIGGIAAQMAAVAVGDFKRAAEIGRMMKVDAEAGRKAFDAWEVSILAVGSASGSTAKQLDTMDQVTRRMISDAEAQARAFLESEKRRKEAEAAAKKAAQEAEQLRKQDQAGWVAYAQHVFDEADKLNQDLAAISKEHWANEDRLRKQDEAGWIAYIEQQQAEYEAGLKALADKQPSALQAMQRQWADYADQVSNVMVDFFADLFENGKSSFGKLWDLIKRWFAQVAALFATRFVLQIAAGAAGGTAGSALAGQAASLGGNSLTGVAADAVSSWLFGSAGTATSTGLAEAGTSGLFGTGGFATTMGEAAGAVFGQAVGDYVVTAIPYIGWIIAIGSLLYSIFGKSGGGPKFEGQFMGGFDAQGKPTGSTGNPFNIIGTSANGSAEQASNILAQGFFNALKQFGGTTSGVQFGVGIVRDPAGDSPTFLDTIVRDAMGRELLRLHDDNVGRSDEDLQAALQSQGQRAILAALQASDLPPALKTIFDSVVAESASLEEIQKVFVEAANFQAMWSQFTAAFATDAERLAQAQGVVNSVFGDLGVEVPKDMEGFKKAAEALYAAGDVDGLKKLFAVADAFKFVVDTSEAAAQALKEQWSSVQDSIDAILGRDRRPGQLNSMLGQLDGQFAGLDLKGLAALVAGFSQEQWSALTTSQRDLIDEILRLGATMNSASGAIVQAVQAIYFPEVGAQSLQGDFERRYGGLIGAAPGGLMGQLSLRSQLMTGQIATWMQQQSGLSEYDPVWQTLQKAIDDFKEKVRLTGVDVARLTVLTAQYGQSKAEELFNLEKWYEAQKALVDGNAEAMKALETIFKGKWKDIIDGIASEDSRARFVDWWRGIFQDQQISPLSLRDRFNLAKTDYEKALAGGDAGRIQSTAQLALELGRQLMGSSTAYTAFFAQIASQTAAFAGISPTELNQRLYGALPQSSPIASSADMGMLARTFSESMRDLVIATLQAAAETQTAVRESGDKVATAVRAREGAVT